MTLYLYKEYPPSNYSENEKLASVHRQWIGLLLFALQLLPILFLLLGKQDNNRIDVSVLFTNTFWIVFMFIFSFLGFIGIIWTIVEIIIYRIIWAGKSFLNRGRFWDAYIDIEKPISLIASLIPMLILLFLGIGMLKNNFDAILNLLQ